MARGGGAEQALGSGFFARLRGRPGTEKPSSAPIKRRYAPRAWLVTPDGARSPLMIDTARGSSSEGYQLLDAAGRARAELQLALVEEEGSAEQGWHAVREWPSVRSANGREVGDILRGLKNDARLLDEKGIGSRAFHRVARDGFLEVGLRETTIKKQTVYTSGGYVQTAAASSTETQLERFDPQTQADEAARYLSKMKGLEAQSQLDQDAERSAGREEQLDQAEIDRRRDERLAAAKALEERLSQGLDQFEREQAEAAATERERRAAAAEQQAREERERAREAVEALRSI